MSSYPRTKRPAVGNRVELTSFENTINPEPPRPWKGKIIEVKTRMAKSRPASLFVVRLDSGETVEAFYRQIGGKA